MNPNEPLAYYNKITAEQAETINDICKIANEWATKKGFNDDEDKVVELVEKFMGPEVGQRVRLAFKLEQHALFTTEISESVEGLRHSNPPDDKVPELQAEEAELADLLIRVFHYAGKRGINLGGALMAKHDFNITRPYKHGKKC